MSVTSERIRTDPGRSNLLLTTQEIKDHLETITYKPGWSFEYYVGRYEGPHLVIWTKVEDAFNPGRTVDLDVQCFLSPNDIDSTESLNKYLAHRLGRIESHECREFLKENGKVIDSPHKPNADRDN